MKQNDTMIKRAEAAFARYAYWGDFQGLAPYGSGHINDTFAVRVNQAGRPVRYLLQRVNGTVFPRPDQLMDNVERICRHTKQRLLDENKTNQSPDDLSRRTLTLLPTQEGAERLVDDYGDYWRCYLFIEGAIGYDIVETPRQCFEAARAFGEFQKWLADLGGAPLYETIADFHNTPKRFSRFQEVIAADSHKRAASVQKEIAFYREREAFGASLQNAYAAGNLPLRVTHNDTKLNNVLIDEETGRAQCVIDLDTAMPGFAAFDFGDLMRTSTSPAAEDEKDASLVTMRMPMFQALAEGYAASAGAFLTDEEKNSMVSGGMLMTYECGMRFLTDYLEGDSYFKTAYPEHNLVRCRTQIALLRSMEAQQSEMEDYWLRQVQSGR